MVLLGHFEVADDEIRAGRGDRARRAVLAEELAVLVEFHSVGGS